MATRNLADYLSRHSLKDRLDRWGNGDAPGNWTPAPHGADKVRKALAQVDSALEALGVRTGERADATRKWLTETREALSAPLAVFDRVGLRCQGEGALALAQKFADALAADGVAREAFRLASPAEIRSARDALDQTEARGREIERESSALLDALAFPSLPDLKAFESAQSQTADLKRQPGPATALHTALDQGRDAHHEVARLWVCFEPADKAGSVYQHRWARYLEAGGRAHAVSTAAE